MYRLFTCQFNGSRERVSVIVITNRFSFDGLLQFYSCVHAGTIPRCDACDGVVKPDVVFFGESLPRRFFDLVRTIE